MSHQIAAMSKSTESDFSSPSTSSIPSRIMLNLRSAVTAWRSSSIESSAPAPHADGIRSYPGLASGKVIVTISADCSLVEDIHRCCSILFIPFLVLRHHPVVDPSLERPAIVWLEETAGGMFRPDIIERRHFIEIVISALISAIIIYVKALVRWPL